MLHIMDVGLRKSPCISLWVIIHFPCFDQLGIYIGLYIISYLVCSLPIHKICALCGIYSAICVLLTTENSNDLEILVPHGSRSLKVMPVNSSCVISYQSLIVPEAVSCTVYYPNVTTLRSGLCYRKSVCLYRLSSVTLVHHTQGVELVANISSPLCTLAVL